MTDYVYKAGDRVKVVAGHDYLIQGKIYYVDRVRESNDKNGQLIYLDDSPAIGWYGWRFELAEANPLYALIVEIEKVRALGYVVNCEVTKTVTKKEKL